MAFDGIRCHGGKINIHGMCVQPVELLYCRYSMKVLLNGKVVFPHGQPLHDTKGGNELEEVDNADDEDDEDGEEVQTDFLFHVHLEESKKKMISHMVRFGCWPDALIIINTYDRVRVRVQGQCRDGRREREIP